MMFIFLRISIIIHDKFVSKLVIRNQPRTVGESGLFENMAYMELYRTLGYV